MHEITKTRVTAARLAVLQRMRTEGYQCLVILEALNKLPGALFTTVRQVQNLAIHYKYDRPAELYGRGGHSDLSWRTAERATLLEDEYPGGAHVADLLARCNELPGLRPVPSENALRKWIDGLALRRDGHAHFPQRDPLDGPDDPAPAAALEEAYSLARIGPLSVAARDRMDRDKEIAGVPMTRAEVLSWAKQNRIKAAEGVPIEAFLATVNDWRFVNYSLPPIRLTDRPMFAGGIIPGQHLIGPSALYDAA